jgi:lysophospholipase L1-like esterase
VNAGAAPILVVGLGDSITAGNPGWDPDPDRRVLEDPGDDERSQYLYWAARKDERIAFRNCGVGGERTDEIRARLEEAVAGADVLVVQGGINDIVQKHSIDLAAEHLHAMVRRGKELGLAVLLAEVLPWNNGWPDADPEIRALNARISEVGAIEAVDVLPFYDTLEDPERPGRMREDWTPDGNHPSVEGHRRLGELAFLLPGRAVARGSAASRRR